MSLAESSIGAVFNERAAIVLGLIAVASLAATFLSCRSSLTFFKSLGWKSASQNRIYQRFYKYHVVYWWAFAVVALSHITIALMHTGLPDPSDPDAPIHWAILALGVSSAGSAGVLFSSCRVFPRLGGMLTGKNPLANPGFKSYFGYHSLYWLVIGAALMGHFAIGFNHAGIWPPLN